MGGMKSGPITMGSSLMGRGSGLVPAPKKVGPIPRRIDGEPDGGHDHRDRPAGR